MTSAGPHLALVGTTASGKSTLAVEVARRLGDVEIVSADAMSVYRGMDVGTAKPTAAARAEVPHHLLDVAEPEEDYSVARFQRAAREVIAAIEERGQRALVVGGSGLYVQAVVDGYDVPGRFPEAAAALAAEPDTAVLHARLTDVDPVAAGRMVPTNRRRVLRALEVTIGSGRPFSSFGPGVGRHLGSRFRMAGVWLPRGVVNDRVAARYRLQVEGGFLEEVAVLAARPEGLSRTARQALGYRELIAHLEQHGHLEKGASLDAALEEAVRRTRAFSRRQRMWFRRDGRIRWFGAADNPGAVLDGLLGDWGR